MVKIFIDAGHGGADSGATGYGLKEKDITLDIAKRIKRYLDHDYDGHSVKLSRTGDTTLSLAQRTNKANQWGADYFLSIHVNAGGGTGYEDYIYSGKVLNDTVSIRDTIHTEVLKQVGNIKDRGKKRANFHVLRESKMSAMLSENLFIDTKQDAAKLQESKIIDRIAKGHAIGLAKTFQIKKSSTSNNQKDRWLGTSLKGKRVESIYRGSEGLNYYDGPRWTNPSGTFGYGLGWIIDNKYLVDGYPMYRVQNSKGEEYYITASSKYVRVIE